MDSFQQIDLAIFYFLNSDIANPIFDIVLPFITNFKNWIPVYLLLIILLAWKGGAKGRIAVLSMIIAVGLTDYISGEFLKSFFARIRPCHELIDVRLLINCGSGKSFPSNHAANNFAMAVVLTHFYKKWTWLFFTLASMVAFSRVYTGVHYFSDIVGGAIFGTIMALLILQAARPAENKFLKISKQPDVNNS